MNLKLEDWKPQEPWQGPPLPEFFNIYWPWYEAPVEVVPPEEVPEEVIDFDLDLPTVAPQEIYPGTAITITCPVTSRCTSKQNIIVKCIIYEGSILPTHGTKITQKSSSTFSIDPGETYNVTIRHTAVKGTIDRRDIEVEVYVNGKLVKQNEWDDVYYVKPEEEVVPQATITSMDWGKISKHQGDLFDVKVHIQSNFAGTAWTIAAYGQGEPTDCCGALQDPTGNFLGFFPIGFSLVHTEDVYGYANIGGLELKKGDNVVTVKMSIDRRYPPGSYIGYFGVFPPAANWYNWDPPYDWAVTNPFEILPEAPPVTIEPVVVENRYCASVMPFSFVEVGFFNMKNNYFAINVNDPLEYPGAEPLSITKKPYYMEFNKPSEEKLTDPDTMLGGYWFRVTSLIPGVYICGWPPKTIYGTPAKLYSLEITAWLTYPDGHTGTSNFSGTIPFFGLDDWQWCHFFDLFIFGKDAALGTYTYRVKIIVEGIEMYDDKRSFTIK